VRGIRELKSKITTLIESFPAGAQVELAKQGGRWMAGEFAKQLKASAAPAKAKRASGSRKSTTSARTTRGASTRSAKTLTRGQKAAATRKANAAAKAAGSTTQETTAQLH
jgi:hypothetical protein